MFYDEFKMKGRFKMKFFKKFAAVLIAMAVFTVGNIGILPRDAVEDFMLSVSAADSDIVASGECGADGDNLTWTLYSERTLTISGKGEMSNWWDASFAPWSYYEKSILNIIVEKGVTTIGDKAFDDCYSLTSITIPDSVTSIGDYAFYNCNSLTSITIPDSVTSIGKYTFYLTPWLYEKREENPLVIVNGILIDGINCEGDVLIPEGVTSIGGSAFYGCNLTSIVIPDSVTSIGDYSFCDCKNLT
ncbi:MAG: leucine-rich repeat domain-containing protein [Ruminococcus sp.]|nr:leucine-rich repeat domain-containing protein [Ruminococcus sp.]